MEKRLNKAKLIELIESLNIDLDEFWVLSSGSLVLRGLMDTAGDLDIAITQKGLEQLKENFALEQKANGWYRVNQNIECVLDEKDDYKVEKIGKYNVESLQKYFDYLSDSTREKDAVKYKIVKKVLTNRKK